MTDYNTYFNLGSTNDIIPDLSSTDTPLDNTNDMMNMIPSECDTNFSSTCDMMNMIPSEMDMIPSECDTNFSSTCGMQDMMTNTDTITDTSTDMMTNTDTMTDTSTDMMANTDTITDTSTDMMTNTDTMTDTSTDMMTNTDTMTDTSTDMMTPECDTTISSIVTGADDTELAENIINAVFGSCPNTDITINSPVGYAFFIDQTTTMGTSAAGGTASTKTLDDALAAITNLTFGTSATLGAVSFLKAKFISLTSLDFGANITILGSSTFDKANLSALTTLDFKNITTLESDTFYQANLSALMKIIFQSAFRTFETYTFDNADLSSLICIINNSLFTTIPKIGGIGGIGPVAPGTTVGACEATDAAAATKPALSERTPSITPQDSAIGFLANQNLKNLVKDFSEIEDFKEIIEKLYKNFIALHSNPLLTKTFFISQLSKLFIEKTNLTENDRIELTQAIGEAIGATTQEIQEAQQQP